MALAFFPADINVKANLSNETSTPDDLPFTHPDNIVNYATFRWVELVLTCVIDPSLWLLGVTNNVINCVIFYRQGRGRERMNLYLLRLVSALNFSLGSKVKAYLTAYVTAPDLAFTISSTALSMIVSVETCLCVARPLQSPGLVTHRTVKLIIGGVVVLPQLAAAGIISSCFEVRSLQSPQSGETIYYTSYTELHTAYSSTLSVLQFLLVGPVLPVVNWTVVSVATAVTVVKLRQASRWRAVNASFTSSHGSATRQATRRSPSQRTEGKNKDNTSRLVRSHLALSKVLVLTSCLHIICYTPSVLVTVAAIAVANDDFTPWGHNSNLFYISLNSCKSLAAVNSSCKFFVYLARSHRFRQMFLALVKPKARVDDSPERKTVKKDICNAINGLN